MAPETNYLSIDEEAVKTVRELAALLLRIWETLS